MFAKWLIVTFALAWVVVVTPAVQAAPDAPAPEAKPPPATVTTVTSLELGRDKDYVFVLVKGEVTLAALAQQYLGSAARAWWIAQVNRLDAVQPGQDILIPLRAPATIGVRWDGYQTVPILCYHRFGARRSKLSVEPAAFAAQMEFLAKHNYYVATLADFRAFLAGEKALPQRTALITIDDGYRSVYEIAYPILKKYGFPATLFLYTDFLGAADALTWPQLREMTQSGLIEIQSHSKTHSNLALKDPKESEVQYRKRVRGEVETSASIIKATLGEDITAFAYPYGDTNDRVMEQLKQNQITLGFTVTPGGNGFYAATHMLRRTMIFGDDDLDQFRAKLHTFSRLESGE